MDLPDGQLRSRRRRTKSVPPRTQSHRMRIFSGDANRWRAYRPMRRGCGRARQRLPEQMILRRRRQDCITLAAKASIEFGLREQRADLRLAAGGEQCQSVERTGQRALLDEFGAALAEPAGQLQSRIIVRAHEAKAMAWRAFRGVEGNDRQRTEFARQRSRRRAASRPVQVPRRRRRSRPADQQSAISLPGR